MLNIFFNETHYSIKSSLLDIGTTPSSEYGQNLLLDYVQNNKKVTCISNQNIMNLKKKYKNIKSFIKGDGKSLPFKDNQFDISYSSATIEHVGSKKEQLQFLKESIRVAKKYIFITTPNRFFPLDFHTKLPLIHWLPKKVHRKILNFLNLKFYAKEKNLNLLDEKEILSLLNKVNYSSFKIRKIFLLFFCSNLLIIIKK